MALMAAVACGGTPYDDDAADTQDVAAGKAAEIVVYSEDGWNELADALAADPASKASYFMHIPAPSGDKTQARGPNEPARMRARGPQFHALAEFHWGAFRDAPGTWYEKGVEFRRRMAAKGYDVSAGDAWAINELPSTTRHDPDVRQHVRDAVRGLYDGPPGSPKVRGAVFVIGVGSGMVNFSVYKPQVESWLRDADFWKTMSGRVRFWGQETYVDPDTSCVPGTSVGLRSESINAFTEHVARLAAAGGSAASAANAFLSRTWTPLLNGAFRADAYQTGGMTLEQMKHFVSGEIYASRAWGAKHAYAAGRAGLGWTYHRDQVNPQEMQELSKRIASAFHGAYDAGSGAAAGACSPSHAYSWCQCSLHAARFNPAWDTFAHW